MMGVTISNLATWLDRFRRMPKAVDTALETQVRKEVEPLVPHMRSTASSYGPMVGKAAAGTHSSTAGVATVEARSSDTLKGAEYGGRKRGKKTYVTQRRRGRNPTGPYIIRRRTTQQFHPHLGNRGYWFWPTARKDLKGINGRVRKALNEAING